MFSSNLIKFVLDIDFENKIKNIKSIYSKISKIVLNKHNIKISRHTISNWIKNKNKIFNERIKREHYKDFKINKTIFTKNRKLKKISLELVSNYIDIYPFSTRLQIRNFIYKDFNILLSFQSVTNIIKKINYTRKKVNFQIIKNLEYLKNLNEKRNIFKKQIKEKYLDKLIFIDEVGFNLTNKNEKGLSKKGKQIYYPDKTRFMRNLSMIMSLNSNHIIEYEIYEEPIDSYKFYNFINRIIKKLNQDGYTFIFDNVSFHYNKEMLKLIQNYNNYVLFTPPYSPDFNPIENVFGIIKNLYRKKYNNISFKNKTFTVKEQINIIESSILDFITIHYINIDKIINRSINFSYEEIENECYLKYN